MIEGAVLAAAWLIAAIGTWMVVRFCAWERALDRPNERSLHTHPVPRLGGLAILAAFILGATFLVLLHRGGVRFLPRLLLCLLPVTIVSLWDDLGGVSVMKRLLIHTSAAGLFVFWDKPMLNHGWFSIAFFIVFIVTMLNIYNFMDGLDGLAAGMTVCGFGSLAILSHLSGFGDLASLCCVLACSCGGFLVFNFPPGRIFMGDVGSASLGFLTGTIVLTGTLIGAFSAGAAAIVFSPFLVDSIVTLVRRLLAREKIWISHRSHYYQRLVLAGYSPRDAVLMEYGLMIVCGIGALFYELSIDRLRHMIMMAFGAGYALLAWRIEQIERFKNDGNNFNKVSVAGR